MRTLTTVYSATDVLVDLELRVLASDASTTWVFDRNSIQTYPAPEWEIDFTGGLGKASNYEITLASSIGFLSENFQKLNRAQTFLKVYTNSDNFTPHVGRIRGINREAHNPNIFSLKVYENFLDGDPLIPVEAIQDSYSTVHPEIIESDFGYPLYYGKHTRPFYFTTTDCYVQILLGPKNVSSANHLADVVYFDATTELTRGMSGTWAQQSGSTNIFSSEYPFFVHELSTTQLVLVPEIEELTGKPVMEVLSQNLLTYAVELSPTDRASFLHSIAYFTPQIPIHRLRKLAVNAEFSDSGSYGIGALRLSLRKVDLDTEYLMPNYEVSTWDNLYTASVNTIFDVEDLNDELYFEERYKTGIEWRIHINGITPAAGGTLTLSCTYGCDVEMKAQAYANYSIYGKPVSSGDIAISENPNAIVADIINQTSFNFVAAQNSAAQVETNSYNFQCFFGERQSLSDILQEFGEITATHYWVGDSGSINTRTYQESEVVTSSIDYTLTTCDFIENSVVIRDNPLGSIYYQTQKASRIKVNYDFDHARNRYNQVMIVDRTNNAFCDSAYFTGIQKEHSAKTKYIMESQTTSYFIDNLIRRYTTDDVIIEGTLPARFMGLEICDILKIQHPSLLNSETLCQVTKVRPNYENGLIKFTANEIINLT